MTVTYIGETGRGRGAENNQGEKTYTRTFILKTSLQSEGPGAVGSHASLPVIGNTHPDDANAYCSSIRVENTWPWRGWTVTCSYTNQRILHPTDPEQDEILISFQSEIYQEVILTDINGEAIVNSAGDFFVDAPTRDAARLIASIKVNLTSVPSWILNYQNAINDASITIGGLTVGQYKAKMQNIQVSERKYRGSTAYYELSFDVHINKDGWIYRPVDNGLRYLATIPNESTSDSDDTMVALKNIVNPGDKQEVTTPALLDGAGGVISDPSPSTAVYLAFHIYPELDFTVLPGIT
jgi:hypothetical protein